MWASGWATSHMALAESTLCTGSISRGSSRRGWPKAQEGTYTAMAPIMRAIWTKTKPTDKESMFQTNSHSMVFGRTRGLWSASTKSSLRRTP